MVHPHLNDSFLEIRMTGPGLQESDSFLESSCKMIHAFGAATAAAADLRALAGLQNPRYVLRPLTYACGWVHLVALPVSGKTVAAQPTPRKRKSETS